MPAASITVNEQRMLSIGAGASVVLTVNDVDNQVQISLNGQDRGMLVGPGGPGFPWSVNLTTDVLPGQPNVLALVAANYKGSGYNPSSMSAFLDVGATRINLNFSENGIPDGITALFTVILTR